MIYCDTNELNWMHMFIQLSSSCRTVSTDLHDPLLSPVSIVHCFRGVLQATSRISTELLYIGSSCSSYLCSSVWRGPREYIANEFILISPAGSCMSGLSNFDNFCDGWKVPIQLLLCRVLRPELVQYSSQYSCVIAITLFLHTIS